MAGPITKTEEVRKLVALHRWKEALKIAKDFTLGLTHEQKLTIGRAWSSYGEGLLMLQMKRDPEACRQAGIKLLKELYGSPAQRL